MGGAWQGKSVAKVAHNYATETTSPINFEKLEINKISHNLINTPTDECST